MSGDSEALPSTMRAWLWTTAAGGLEKNLHLSESAIRPGQQLHEDQVVVQVISMSLNPADYKVPEMGLTAKLIISTPSSPGIDFCGRVVAMGSEVKDFTLGQLVFGCLGRPRQFGPLAEYTVCPSQSIAPLPKGLDPDIAASIGVAGGTAYQVLEPPATAGDRIFINGGSGGVGMFCIQIAKILGWHVTTTCSTRNVVLCHDLGADEVIDYSKVDVVQTLKEMGPVFSRVLENVGTPENLYRECHHFLRPGCTFVQVTATITSAARQLIQPGFLGGGKRKLDLVVLASKQSSLIQLGDWIQEGKIKVIIDSTFEFEDAIKAYEKLRTHRARGKIVVHVAEKP
ncbi:related to zinc alcohol dehydrogenase [Phialocephala subalpina]|uniref:Related to zinc alcohol dehydrogenase n=1 Tax=Phialocephala subalpina TaxID=576137 RepID=A0A1L7X6D3_9HELO|nr:related to zinc alcohol dehydrogenase [Phialocephala subalpina]